MRRTAEAWPASTAPPPTRRHRHMYTHTHAWPATSTAGDGAAAVGASHVFPCLGTPHLLAREFRSGDGIVRRRTPPQASVHSSLQFSAIKSAIAGKGEPTHAVWIGLNDRIAEAGTDSSKFVWSDNSSAWAATPWAAGQPAADQAYVKGGHKITGDTYVSLVMQGPKANPTTPFYLGKQAPGTFQSTAGLNERLQLKKAMWNCWGFSDRTQTKAQQTRSPPADCWGNTTGLHSGDVVAIFFVANSRVADCASCGCSSQAYPIPTGHWGSP